VSLIQLVLVLFAAFAAARVLGRFRAGVIRLPECLLWMGLWAGVAIVVLDPNLTQRVARVLGVGRGVDAVFYLTIVVLFYLVFRVHMRMRGLEQQLTELVRKLALLPPK
jgi:hypothetical protein